MVSAVMSKSKQRCNGANANRAEDPSNQRSDTPPNSQLPSYDWLVSSILADRGAGGLQAQTELKMIVLGPASHIETALGGRQAGWICDGMAGKAQGIHRVRA